MFVCVACASCPCVVRPCVGDPIFDWLFSVEDFDSFWVVFNSLPNQIIHGFNCWQLKPYRYKPGFVSRILYIASVWLFFHLAYEVPLPSQPTPHQICLYTSNISTARYARITDSIRPLDVKYIAEAPKVNPIYVSEEYNMLDRTTAMYTFSLVFNLTPWDRNALSWSFPKATCC